MWQTPRLLSLDMVQPFAPSHSKRSSSYPKGPSFRLLTYLCRLHHPKTFPEGVNVLPPTADAPDPSRPPTPEDDHSSSIDPGALCEYVVDLVPHLPSLLPASCEWVEQGALEVGGERPVNAGSVADVWIGRMGDRKVAIKSFRHSSHSDHRLTYVVSDA